MKQGDRIQLTRPIYDRGLQCGDLGTIIQPYGGRHYIAMDQGPEFPDEAISWRPVPYREPDR